MSFLTDILDVKKEEIRKLRNDYSLNRFSDSEFFKVKNLSLLNALQKKDSIAIIGEIKKASPSKGIFKKDFNHLKIADIYIENGIDAVSILTDRIFFQGDMNFLSDIARIKTVPLLRKDFILDEYQIYEAKSNGADAVLLISEILSTGQINDLSHCAYEIGLDILLELHSPDEMSKINFSTNNLIGINNRNLNTFIVDPDTTRQIAELIPKGIVKVSESGISTRNNLAILKKAGINGVLIGEHFMTGSNLSDSIKEMKEWCSLEN